MRLERRLEQPAGCGRRPLGSLVVAFGLMAVVLLATGHDPSATYRRLFDSAFFADGALTSTLVFATPIVFTGLAAAAAFRMQLFNIGGEGQFYLGAIAAVGIALYLGDRGVDSTPLYVVAMCVGGRSRCARGRRSPALRAFAQTNEIITSLMLNYVAGPASDVPHHRQPVVLAGPRVVRGADVPARKSFHPGGAEWPRSTSTSSSGLCAARVRDRSRSPSLSGPSTRRTRFGFEVQVIGDLARAARFAGMRLRRKIVAVMCSRARSPESEAPPFEGDFAYQIDPTGPAELVLRLHGHRRRGARPYNPLAVSPSASSSVAS